MTGAPAVASWTALGTGAAVVVHEPGALGVARAAVEAELAAVDLACSRFRPDSELSRVNRADGRPVLVSPLFLEALQAAVHAAVVSGGIVDPTIGQALVLAGYDRDFSLMDRDLGVDERRTVPRVHVRSSPGLDAIDIDRDRCSVTVARGVALDLGASAKALAAQRSARAAASATGAGALVSLGGDIAVAGAAPAGGWLVRVCEDHAAGPLEPSQNVTIAGGGLATSSTMVRRWRVGAQERHHIIDPGSGRPAQVVWRTATVAAGSCLDANTAATATIVLGHRAPSWLAAAGLPARLISADGHIVRVAGWPAEAEDAP